MKSWANVAAVWALVTCGTAFAGNAEADALFQQGRALLAEGKVAKACAAFEGSLSVEPALGTMLNLAACEERMGSLARAWKRFDDAAALAELKKDPRATFARSRQKELTPRLAMVLLDVGPVVPDSQLVVGSLKLHPQESKLVLPAEPGPTFIRFTSPRTVDWERTVETPAGKTTTVTIAPEAAKAEPPKLETPPIEKKSAELKPAPAAVEPAKAEPPRAPQLALDVVAVTSAGPTHARKSPTGLALLAGGGTVAAASIAALVWSSARLGAVQSQRVGTPVHPGDVWVMTRDEFMATRAAFIGGWVGLGLGAAALTAGALLSRPEREEPAFSMVLLPGGGAVTLSGRW